MGNVGEAAEVLGAIAVGFTVVTVVIQLAHDSNAQQRERERIERERLARIERERLGRATAADVATKRQQGHSQGTRRQVSDKFARAQTSRSSFCKPQVLQQMIISTPSTTSTESPASPINSNNNLTTGLNTGTLSRESHRGEEADDIVDPEGDLIKYVVSRKITNSCMLVKNPNSQKLVLQLTERMKQKASSSDSSTSQAHVDKEWYSDFICEMDSIIEQLSQGLAESATTTMSHADAHQLLISLTKHVVHYLIQLEKEAVEEEEDEEDEEEDVSNKMEHILRTVIVYLFSE